MPRPHHSCCLGWLLLTALAGALAAAQPPAWIQEGAVRRLSVIPAQPGVPGFEVLGADHTGVNFTNRLADLSAGYNQVRMNGSGVALGDVDGDGWCDIYLCGLESPNRLFRNLGDWRFADITRESGVECLGQYSTGAAFADFDGDGDLDLLVNSIEQGTRLFFNNSKGSFTEKSPAVMRRPSGSMSAAIGDLDGDADLDLYVVNYRTNTIRSTGFSMIVSGKGQIRPEYRGQYEVSPEGRLLENGEPDAFYLNDGRGNFELVSWIDGRFVDEDGRALAAPPRDWGLSAFIHDFDGDGTPDVYVCNDFWSPDRLWLNDGKGRFRAAPRLMLRHTSNYSMGIDVADIDRDGRDDFLVLDMLSIDPRQRARQRAALGLTANDPYKIDSRPQIERNTLFWNRGDGTYAEVAQQAGLQASEWSWGAAFLDVDLDGYEDLLITNGHLFDMLDDDIGLRMAAAPRRPLAERLLVAPRLNVPNVAFRNRGDRTFEEVGSRWGFDTVGVSHGLAQADLDLDGDLDVVINHLNAPAGLYRNRASGARLGVRLRGSGPNTQGVGAKLTLKGGNITQSQTVICGGRYLSSDDGLRVFAAVSSSNQFRLEIRWPDGALSVTEGLRGNHVYEIEQALVVKHKEQPLSASPNPEPWFADTSSLLNHSHQENAFDDLARQAVLSRRLDTSGPGVSWIDWDGDGWDDLWIAGAGAGAPGLLHNKGQGGFVALAQAATSLTGGADQTSLVGWRPSDPAGCLLIGLSPYERSSNAPSHLFQFNPRQSTLEAVPNGDAAAPGPMAMADVNGDGQLDLFVGGGAIPAEYPRAATSRLMLRDGAGWRVDTNSVAGSRPVGIVNGAVFGDLDGDGDPDLVLAVEWGTIQVWMNEGGHLVQRTQQWGLDRYEGWWNGVTTADFDGDGRLDLAASNWGRNTPYQPFASSGIQIFYGDISGRGGFEMWEAITDPLRHTLMPWRDRKTLFRVMPWLQERFSSAEAFAQATLAEIVGEGLERAQKVGATWLDSTIFLNRGDHLEAVRLPWEAQTAPAFGICAADFDADGKDDLFLAQNFFGVESTVARYDGGRGLVLKGDGAGGFSPLPSNLSGIRVDGEQRGAAVSDYDADGRLDLAVGQNNAPARLFRNRAGKPGLRVRLQGNPENPMGFGCAIRPRYGDRLGPLREVRAGSGFRSMDSTVVVLARPGPEPLTGLRVRWPGRPAQDVMIPSAAAEVVVDSGGSVKVVR
jgi:hypothetical protein